MNIVDSQVRIWSADTPDHPWPPGRAQEAQKPYAISKEALLFQMDLASVRRVVIVPPSWEGDRNDIALDAARTYPGRFAPQSAAPPHHPDTTPVRRGSAGGRRLAAEPPPMAPARACQATFAWASP